MNNSGLMKNNNLALLLLRLGVGVIFVISGWGKLTGIEGVQGFFGNMGIPLANVMAWVVAIVEFAGGLMVLIGYKIRIPGLLLAFVMLVAIIVLLTNTDNGFSGVRLEIMLLLTNLGLVVLGTGEYSVEAMMDKSAGGDTGGGPEPASHAHSDSDSHSHPM